MSITAIIGFAAVIEAGMRHRELTDIYEQRDLDASVRFAKMEALEGNTPLFEFAFAWMYAVCFGTLGVWLSVGIVWGIRGDC